MKKGQQIELTGEITRIDEEGGRVTVDLGPLVTIDIDKVRLVEKYRTPNARSRCATWRISSRTAAYPRDIGTTQTNGNFPSECV
ncbi:hypothetical protein [Mesorhizobium sp. M1307]|uniref:hypothetical protein n=1 Tax=Mesorhizobium sp. M1307 TaxID=2957079 RepID=UPI00333DCF05